jgi:hypothetical protein
MGMYSGWGLKQPDMSARSEAHSCNRLQGTRSGAAQTLSRACRPIRVLESGVIAGYERAGRCL